MSGDTPGVDHTHVGGAAEETRPRVSTSSFSKVQTTDPKSSLDSVFRAIAGLKAVEGTPAGVCFSACIVCYSCMRLLVCVPVHVLFADKTVVDSPTVTGRILETTVFQESCGSYYVWSS